MEGNVGVDVDSIGAVNEGICLIVGELMSYDLVSCEIGWELRDMIAGDLIPPKELQAYSRSVRRSNGPDHLSILHVERSIAERQLEHHPQILERESNQPNSFDYDTVEGQFAIPANTAQEISCK